jgi:hypothetical protein
LLTVFAWRFLKRQFPDNRSLQQFAKHRVIAENAALEAAVSSLQTKKPNRLEELILNWAGGACNYEAQTRYSLGIGTDLWLGRRYDGLYPGSLGAVDGFCVDGSDQSLTAPALIS